MAGSAAFGLVVAAATLPGSVVGRLMVAAVAFVLMAASFSAMTAGAFAFIGDVAPVERESELMGLRSTAQGAGGVLGPVTISAVATVTGYVTAFVLSGLLAVIATVLVTVRLVESQGTAVATDPIRLDDD